MVHFLQIITFEVLSLVVELNLVGCHFVQVRGSSEPGFLNSFEKVRYVFWLHHIVAPLLNTLHILKFKVSVNFSVDILHST